MTEEGSPMHHDTDINFLVTKEGSPMHDNTDINFLVAEEGSPMRDNSQVIETVSKGFVFKIRRL